MQLTESLDRLAGFEPVPFPVLSLYLDARPDATGRDAFEPFLRKTFREREQTWPAHAPERESFTRDVERILSWIGRELRPSANGVALFACAAADFFEAVQLDVPIEGHHLYIDHRPHLYPLARLDDQYPRYAAVVLDTNLARIFVFGLGQPLRTEQVQSPKAKQVKVGGWSQARYQRHVENFHQQHVKEVVDVLDRVVREEGLQHVVLAGDEVVIPLVRQQLPPHLAERVIDVVKLDITSPDRLVLETTLDALRRKDAQTDAEVVDRLFEAVRGGGLGVIGAAATLEALRRGQVDELIITARADLLTNVADLPAEGAPPQHAPNAEQGLAAVDRAAADAERATEPVVSPEEKAADRLVTLARQTAAGVRFIEDPALLAEVGGVGARLRYAS